MQAGVIRTMRNGNAEAVESGAAGPAILDADGVREEIEDVETRAAALNLTLSKLCGLAGEPVYNVFRWRNGTTAPGLFKYRATMAALEKALVNERTRLRKVLEDAA